MNYCYQCDMEVSDLKKHQALHLRETPETEEAADNWYAYVYPSYDDWLEDTREG